MNPTLNKMVYALINDDQEKAKEYLSVFFNDTTARRINGTDEPEAPEAPAPSDP
jgi:hypothetical protein